MSETTIVTARVNLPTAADVDKAVALLEKVDKGKPAPADLEELRRMFDKFPDLWRVSGDVIQTAARRLLNDATTQASIRESMTRGFVETQRLLGWDKAPGAERLLIEACALAWLRFGIVEYQYSHVMSESVTLAKGDYWERKLSAAHRRYLHALETLAKVRRLSVPALQVNVAQPGARQLNVATGSA